MTRQVMILVDEDCFSGLDYVVTANGNIMRKSEGNSSVRQYTANIDAESCHIEIQRTDEWNDSSVLFKIFHVLYMLVLEFGYIMENLPIYVKYSRNICINDDAAICIELKHSEFLSTTIKDINFWYKIAMLQMVGLGLIIAILGIALSFLFDGVVQCSFIALVLIADILLTIALNKRVQKMKEQLQSISIRN